MNQDNLDGNSRSINSGVTSYSTRKYSSAVGNIYRTLAGCHESELKP